MRKALSIIFVVAIMLSTLLAFVIDWWIVLIINGCAIVLYRLIFRGIEFSVWASLVFYVLVGLLSVAIIVLVMYFPEKICGGSLQNISDLAYIKKYFKSQNVDGIISEYRKSLGWCLSILALGYIISGIWLIYTATQTDDVLAPFFLVKPLSNMGALMLLLMPGYVSSCLGPTFGYIIGINVINILYTYISREANGGGNDYDYSSGGGSNDEYDIIIVKH